MCSSSPKTPKPPPPAPEAERPAETPQTSVGAGARADDAKKRGRTRSGTLLTSGSGLQTQANTQQSTLLGG